jgi:hypothetical protein
MTNISIKEIHDLINKKEITDIADKQKSFIKIYDECYKKQSQILNDMFDITKFLFKEPNKEKVILITDLPDENNKPTNIMLRIRNSGFKLSTGNTPFDIARFSYFTNTKGIHSNPACFLKAIYGYPKVYENLKPHLNENGLDVFEKIKELNDSLYFNQIHNKWNNYMINNLTTDEKEILKFKTPNASLTFRCNDFDIFVFIGNTICPKDTPKPEFDCAVFDERRTRGSYTASYIYEKLFILKHYDDIKKGFETFETNEISKVQQHINFINSVNKILTKYTVLSKI